MSLNYEPEVRHGRVHHLVVCEECEGQGEVYYCRFHSYGVCDCGSFVPCDCENGYRDLTTCTCDGCEVLRA